MEGIVYVVPCDWKEIGMVEGEKEGQYLDRHVSISVYSIKLLILLNSQVNSKVMYYGYHNIYS